MPSTFLDVDPATLLLPPTRMSGADPYKLQQQIARFGSTTTGMPPLVAYHTLDGAIMVWDGVTRATRVAKLLPGQLIRIEILGTVRLLATKYPKVGDRIS
jgi:hypothetical protein